MSERGGRAACRAYLLAPRKISTPSPFLGSITVTGEVSSGVGRGTPSGGTWLPHARTVPWAKRSVQTHTRRLGVDTYWLFDVCRPWLA